MSVKLTKYIFNYTYTEKEGMAKECFFAILPCYQEILRDYVSLRLAFRGVAWRGLAYRARACSFIFGV